MIAHLSYHLDPHFKNPGLAPMLHDSLVQHVFVSLLSVTLLRVSSYFKKCQTRGQNTSISSIISYFCEIAGHKVTVQDYDKLESMQLRKHCISKVERHRARRSGPTSGQTFWVFQAFCFENIARVLVWQPLGAAWPWKRPPLKLNKFYPTDFAVNPYSLLRML